MFFEVNCALNADTVPMYEGNGSKKVREKVREKVIKRE